MIDLHNNDYRPYTKELANKTGMETRELIREIYDETASLVDIRDTENYIAYIDHCYTVVELDKIVKTLCSNS